MSVNLRYPSITGRSEKDQITQLKSYLYQLVDDLNYVLPNLESGSGATQTESAQTYEKQGTEMSYYELRSLIIQDLQQVQKMVDELEANYVARSGWGADKFLVTDATGRVVARKLTFTLNDDGNITYKMEE